MSKIGLRLSVAFLFLAALPLGCAQSSSSPPAGSGGSGGNSSAGGTGGGGSSAKGGSSGNGGSSANGGSGGSSSATGGSSGTGGAGSGGSTATGGGGAGSGGSSGTGGDGTGGSSTGGGGGTSPSDGGTGGKQSDAKDGAVGDGSGGTTTADDGGEAGGTCTDNTQNNDETDLDCGGGTCPRCGSGLKCNADGDCRTGTCTAGKCADGFAPTAPVTNNNGSNIWTITLGTVIFEVDASSAGKVYTFSIDGTDVVAKNIAATGSEFWTSPQSGWYTNGSTWPPPPEMTSSKYTPSSKDNILTMTGPAWGGGLSITKRFWGNAEHQAMTLEYTIKNGTTAAAPNAPWEITRVYAGGLSFFPNADTWVRLGDPSFIIAPVTTSQGAVWFNDNATSYTANVKGGADGLEGWAAHIVCGTGLKKTCAAGGASPILIKQWTDTPASNETVNPTEREVEFYVDSGNSYEEFEQQGLFQPIPAGGTLVWTMHWLLRYLPSTVAPTPGASLLTWVRGQLL